jgi:transcriptional regulator with XRE-family HTH domain
MDKIEQGKRLKELRNYLHLTQDDFGNKIGLKWSQVKDRESGAVKISPSEAKIISHVYGISYDWLLDGRGEMLSAPTNSPINMPVNEAPMPYGAIPTTNDHPDISPLLLKTAVVLESPSIFSSALKSNIEAFHQAVTLDQKLIKAQAEIVQHTDKLKDQDDRLKILESRLLSEKTEKTG